MLALLRVRSLAIVDALDLELGPGLQVITGETGAGKSVLVAALQLVAGGRANADLVRTGAEEAEVEALFDLSAAPHVRARVREVTGLDDDELVIRRVLRANGRSRAFVNGRLATGSQVLRLAAPLVDICSQHEHHTLRDAGSHMDLLDAWAGHDGARQAMAQAWDRVRRATEELDQLASRVRARSEREAVLRFQLDEIGAAAPRDGELEDLQEEQNRLAHAERLAEVTRRAESVLYADDRAVAGRIARVVHELEEVRALDPALDALAGQLAEAHARIEDVGAEIGRYTRRVVHDPERLAEVEARLATLRRLVRKYGGTWERLLAHQEAVHEELAALDDAEGRLEDLEIARQRAVDAAIAAARALSASRREAAARLGTSITGELRELGMGDARVEVDVAPVERRGGLEADGATITAQGMDRVELLIAPNRGEPPRSLPRIASGGELSRALLAIKRVLATQGPRALHVFDEVDAGVGGGIAEVIGRKLHDVSRSGQVLCITHLPQIAVYADRHFRVQKGPVGDRTVSEVVRLDEASRREEVARMMGGLEITEATRSAADALLTQARAARA